MSSIRLLSLPEIPRDVVFNIMGPAELYYMATTSKRVKILATRAGKRLKFDLLIVEFGDFFRVIYGMKADEERRTVLTAQSADEIMRMVEMIGDVFGISITRLFLRQRDAPTFDVGQVFRWINARQSSCESYTYVFHRPLSLENAQVLLQNATANKVTVAMTVPSEVSSEWGNSVDHLHIQARVPFRISSRMQCSVLHVHRGVFPSGGIRQIIRLWMHGRLPRFEALVYETVLELTAVLRTIEHREVLNGARREFTSSNGMFSCVVQGGFEVRRADGRVGMLCIESGFRPRIVFLVWPLPAS